MNRRLFLLAFASTLALPAAAQAQEARPSLDHYRGIVAANPLGIPFDIVSIEAETTIMDAATVGVVGSYNDIDSRRYTTFDARFKYYPAETAMRGFSVGMSGGMTKFRGQCTSVDISGTAWWPVR